MPHRRPRGKGLPALQGHVRQLRELAAALGVTDDTITAWRKNGAPAGPPYSIIEWYLWGKAKGYSPRLPEDEKLRALCQRGARAPIVVDANGEVVQQAGIPVSLLRVGVQLGIHPPDDADIMDEGMRVQAWQRWAAAVEKAQQVMENDGQLLRADFVERKLKAIADTVLEQLGEAHSLTREVDGLTQLQRAKIRDNVQAWITSTRIRLGQRAARA